MASSVESAAKATIDLSDLLSVTINSKQLEVVLGSVLTRLDALEKNGNRHKDDAEVGGPSSSSEEVNNNNNNVGGDHTSDFADAIAKLREDLEKERLRSDNQQEAINDLEEAKEQLAKQLADADKAIQRLRDQLADLDERKEDKGGKKNNNNNNADGSVADEGAHKKRNSSVTNNAFDPTSILKDLDALKKAVDDANAGNSNNAARLATLEGIASTADPAAAKDNGLTSFTDTLNDVLNKQRDLEAAAAAKDKNNDELIDDLQRRVADLEKKVADQQDAIQNKNDQQQKPLVDGVTRADLDALTKDLLSRIPASSSSGAAGGNSLTAADRKLLDEIAEELEGLKNALANNHKNNTGSGDGKDLEPRVAALEAAAEALRKGLDQHKQDTTRAIDDANNNIADVKDALQNAVKEIKALGQECSKNTADCKLLHDKKADKDGAKGPSTPTSEAAAVVVGAASSPTTDGTNNNALAGLQKMVDALDGRVSGLAQDKAGKDAVAQLVRDLNDLRNAVKGLQQGGVASTNANANNGAAAAGANGLNGSDANVDQLAKDMKDLQKRLDDLENWTKGQLIEIRATVDHIHHSKADSAIVANKAERDYVENAMEKLMHEVENVLNATNAGLIDTLDKSLNILRDMIDGKATKQDINKLQGMMGSAGANNGAGANGAGEVPDGLASYKAYRCLGCNRTMDTMRPRPMGSTMNSFTSRVPPASGRNAPASSQGPRPTLALPQSPSPPPGGYIQSGPTKGVNQSI